MKSMKLFGILFLFLCTISFASCSDDDDDVRDPADAITLNMLNEKNGSTLLGNSDVYINNSYNFKTNSCYIADMGKASGLGAKVPSNLNTIAQEVAVVPGHLYHIYDQRTLLDFPSGKRATRVGTGYYKAYVVTPLTHDNMTTGAIVKYVLTYPEAKGLPEYDELIGEVNRVGDCIEYTLPKDVEYMYSDYLNEGKSSFDIHIINGKLTITLLEPIDMYYGPYGTYGIYLRSGATYTFIKFNAGVNR